MKIYMIILSLLTGMHLYYAQADTLTLGSSYEEEILIESNIPEEIKKLQKLESLAIEYNKEEVSSQVDSRKNILIYIRSKHYNSKVWQLCAGKEDGQFSNYVKKNAPELESLRDYDTFISPYTNEKITFLHMIGALNMAYSGYKELGSWAGDLVQLTANLKNKHKRNDDLNDAATQLLCKESQFTEEEMLADIDSININEILKNNKEMQLSDAMIQYYYSLGKSEKAERYRLFIRNQFKETVVSKEYIMKKTREIMLEDAYINILLRSYGIQPETEEDMAYLEAAINAFSDYIFNHCPRDMCVDNMILQ